MKKLWAYVLLLCLVSPFAFAQTALETPPLLGSAPSTPPNGLRYFPGVTQNVDLEIDFEADPAFVASSTNTGYNCNDETPWGFWLFDEFNIDTSAGNRMVTIAPNGRLCIVPSSLECSSAHDRVSRG